jgi:hypothetical protein
LLFGKEWNGREWIEMRRWENEKLYILCERKI